METLHLRHLILEGRYEVKAELVAEAIMSWWGPGSPSANRAESSSGRPEQLESEGLPPVTPRGRAPEPPGI